MGVVLTRDPCGRPVIGRGRCGVEERDLQVEGGRCRVCRRVWPIGRCGECHLAFVTVPCDMRATGRGGGRRRLPHRGRREGDDAGSESLADRRSGSRRVESYRGGPRERAAVCEAGAQRRRRRRAGRWSGRVSTKTAGASPAYARIVVRTVRSWPSSATVAARAAARAAAFERPSSSARSRWDRAAAGGWAGSPATSAARSPPSATTASQSAAAISSRSCSHMSTSLAYAASASTWLSPRRSRGDQRPRPGRPAAASSRAGRSGDERPRRCGSRHA